MSYVLPSNSMPSKILYIDSRDANIYLASIDSQDHNNTGQLVNNKLTSYFSYQLKEKIEVPLNQRALISLNSATIPYSFYNVRHNINDKLTIKAKNNTTGVEITKNLIIDSGNYTAYTLAAVLETFINGTVQDPANEIEFSIDISFDLDKQKYQYTLTSKNNTAPVGAMPSITLTFVFTNQNIVLTPHIELGFDTISDFVITLPATNAGVIANPTTLFSSNVIDVNGSIHGVYVRTNLVSDGTLDSQSGTFSSILSRIPININAGGIIFATPNNAIHRSIVDLRYIDTLTIRLTDERNRLLDLNGLHFQLAIAIDFIYGEKKHTIPMGHLTQNSGYSYHRIGDNENNDNINDQANNNNLEIKKDKPPLLSRKDKE